MAIYKFKIVWDENEEVERVILIKSNQTFEDFFHAITDAFELTNKDVSASFFSSDDYWDKHIEITLKKEDIQGDEKLMRQTKIASLIEQPRQRFVFVYDAQLQLTFLIELIKIEKEDVLSSSENFPKVVSSKNKIPNRRKKIQTTRASDASLAATNTNSLSDDDIDQMIYQNLLNNNISEDDILSGKLDKLFAGTDSSKPADILDDSDEEDVEDIFDEEDDIYDDDEFNQDGYYDMNDEYEN
ncbi:MAG: hypothetical protein KatS3mg027_1717 [Bacteroidia bacterium]|nr:MAG: hypothetical protein KatS3mg027_1717 [Bacteroidia bacterium]